eukprot:150908-Amphidinium_carterae.1
MQIALQGIVVPFHEDVQFSVPLTGSVGCWTKCVQLFLVHFSVSSRVDCLKSGATKVMKSHSCLKPSWISLYTSSETACFQRLTTVSSARTAIGIIKSVCTVIIYSTYE